MQGPKERVHSRRSGFASTRLKVNLSMNFGLRLQWEPPRWLKRYSPTLRLFEPANHCRAASWTCFNPSSHSGPLKLVIETFHSDIIVSPSFISSDMYTRSFQAIPYVGSDSSEPTLTHLSKVSSPQSTSQRCSQRARASIIRHSIFGLSIARARACSCSMIYPSLHFSPPKPMPKLFP